MTTSDELTHDEAIDLHRLGQLIDKVTTSAMESRDEVSALRTKVERLETDLGNCRVTYDEAVRQLSERTSEVQACRRERDELRDRVDALIDVNHTWKRSLQVAERAVAELEKERAQLKRALVPGLEPVKLENSEVSLYSTHPADKCAGEYCTIHNRSDHHMRAWPQHWRGDRGFMERTCPHGQGHPDPDEVSVAAWGAHACDGCCHPERDADQCPASGDPITTALGKASKEKFEKAWKAGKPHGCTIHEGDIASVVKCSDCDYSLEASNFLAQALKAAHEAGRTADTRGMTANYMARSFLMNKSMLKTDGTHEFVKLTEDNAGLILAAFPEQVSAVRKQEVAEYLFLRHPPHNYEYEYDEGTWLRVESDHLTPATDEETERLNDDNV